ncbi:MAG: Crp/Fnr family transcriptional regulator [Cyanobacteriota bacterium]|jgi:CRP/FNR family cyclic AMP-dependent transcriptional regulator
MAIRLKFLDILDSELRQQLLEGNRPLVIPAGHQLLFREDWGEEVFLISEGIAKACSLTSRGDEVVFSLMGEGTMIGDLAVLSTKPIRTVDVVALTSMSLIKLRHRALQDAMESNPPLMRAIAFVQAQRLCALGDRLMLMNEDAQTRLLATLLDLACLNGPKDDPLQFIPPITQQDIAIIAGLSRGTTSTLLNKLRTNGTLKLTENGLRFANLTPLQKRGLIPEDKS